MKVEAFKWIDIMYMRMKAYAISKYFIFVMFFKYLRKSAFLFIDPSKKEIKGEIRNGFLLLTIFPNNP